MKGLPSFIAPSGHSGKHAPHATQLSIIRYDIFSTTIGKTTPRERITGLKTCFYNPAAKKILSGPLNRDYLFDLRHTVFNRALDAHD